jgi:DNA polymerase-3 subunit epsilon
MPTRTLTSSTASPNGWGFAITGRHSALGDACTTGEVFLKMLPLLAQMGIVTLRQALEASEKTYFARVKY